MDKKTDTKWLLLCKKNRLEIQNNPKLRWHLKVLLRCQLFGFVLALYVLDPQLPEDAPHLQAIAHVDLKLFERLEVFGRLSGVNLHQLLFNLRYPLPVQPANETVDRLSRDQVHLSAKAFVILNGCHSSIKFYLYFIIFIIFIYSLFSEDGKLFFQVGQVVDEVVTLLVAVLGVHV